MNVLKRYELNVLINRLMAGLGLTDDELEFVRRWVATERKKQSRFIGALVFLATAAFGVAMFLLITKQ